MKTSTIAAVAVLALAAGFNAQAQSRDEFYVAPALKSFTSTLTRAQVQTEAVKHVREQAAQGQTGYAPASDEYFYAAPAANDSKLTREAVRAEAIRSRVISAPQEILG